MHENVIMKPDMLWPDHLLNLYVVFAGVFGLGLEDHMYKPLLDLFGFQGLLSGSLKCL